MVERTLSEHNCSFCQNTTFINTVIIWKTMPEENVTPVSSKKIKFRSISTTTEPLLDGSKTDDMYYLRPRSKSELKYKRKETTSISEGDEGN